jgi:hypothetical protein
MLFVAPKIILVKNGRPIQSQLLIRIEGVTFLEGPKVYFLNEVIIILAVNHEHAIAFVCDWRLLRLHASKVRLIGVVTF